MSDGRTTRTAGGDDVGRKWPLTAVEKSLTCGGDNNRCNGPLCQSDKAGRAKAKNSGVSRRSRHGPLCRVSWGECSNELAASALGRNYATQYIVS
jgi:hypothetical protein